MRASERTRNGDSLNILVRRPIGCPPQVWDALLEIHYAQQRLEDDYPNWTAHGKKYAVESAVLALRQAHQRIMHYVLEVENAISNLP